MQLLQTLSNVSKRLWNVANTYWKEGEPPGLMRNDTKRLKNLHIAKRLPPSSDMRRDSEHKAKWPNGSPAPSKWPPNGLTHAPSTLSDPRQHGKIKMKSKNISIVRTRPSAYRTLVVTMQPLRLISTPTDPSGIIAGGSPTLYVRYNEVSDARNVETRGIRHPRDHTHGIPIISPSRGPTKCWKSPWYVAGTHWMQGVSKRIKTSSENISDARTRRYTKYRMKQPNGSPELPYRSPNDLAHPPGILRDPRRRGRIKTKPENISKSGQKGCKRLMLPSMPISPLRHLSKHLWNVANTYWRQGVPPGQTQNDNKPVIFKTAALAITVQGQGARAPQPSPKQEVATMRRGKHD
ncbi:hypothetical protein EDC04DRAFT_3143916 [Pisolithus marmoratus]|nr:hypothetical protein EDC04DRAFT_3143916 [Pisolithus marmoratus]